MNRRQFLALAGTWASAAAMGRDRGAPAQPASPADVTLRIGDVTWELGPKRTIRTTAYNGQVPGPVLRARAGKPLVVDVWNDTTQQDIVHWHGFHIPPDVDGAIEEGTPPVPPKSHRRYVFTPDPAGTRWYHSHGLAGRNLKKSTYTGQFGLFVVEDGRDPGDYDREEPVLLHEWDPHFTREGPLDVDFRYFSINGKMAGAGEPIRVRASQRVLFRIVNASATLHHRLALPRHQFLVTALDGNAVPNPTRVPIVDVSPGERVDAIVEMNEPGVWILGDMRNDYRSGGMGIVVEYAGEQGPPRWEPLRPFVWNYGIFGGGAAPPEPDGRLTLVFRAASDGHHWTINGKSHPRADDIVVQPNKR